MSAHPVSDPSVVWYGGIGHKLLTIDGGGVECYRCGMAAEPDALQECVPDCDGPDVTGHHWLGGWSSDGITPRNECAYGDAWQSPDGGEEQAGGGCRRS